MKTQHTQHAEESVRGQVAAPCCLYAVLIALFAVVMWVATWGGAR